jgi:hypothetical protein
MDYEKIKPYIEKGLVSEQVHPEDANVRIFNYTQACQFAKAWDDVTVQCRGLIINVATGEVLAHPFKKFFNYEEHIEKNLPIPAEEFEVYGKMDGSLGILYALNGKSWIATRGSFMSDQAQWATKWFRKAMETDNDVTKKGQTALFEIIYPENRIVVNYSFSGLVHLATLDIATGKAVADMWPDPFKVVPQIDCDDITTLKGREEENAEGYVIHFRDSDLRLKIKFAEYVRLHKIITGVSEIGIWEILRDGGSLKPLIEKVPDEFFKWVSDVSTKLLDRYDEIADKAEGIFQEVKNLPTRKDQALAIQKLSPELSGIVFCLLDKEGKRGAAIIWKMIRPHGKSIFKTDIDL